MDNDIVVAAAASIDGRGVYSRLLRVVGLWRATLDGGNFWGNAEGAACGELDFERYRRRCGGWRRWQWYSGLGCGLRIGVPTSAFALADRTDVVVVFVLNRFELHHGIGMRRRHCGRRLLWGD